MRKVGIEICVDSLASLKTAEAGDIDRIELCAALDVGGITPSTGFMLAAAGVRTPTYAMIRPRAGDFAFTDKEVDLMIEDIRACREIGLAGVVVGAAVDGWLDEAALGALVHSADGLGVTLNRAFDLVDDPLLAIDIAIDLGIERILTSGGARTALEGAEAIHRYVEHADGRLSIMAGGGIDADNAAQIVGQTGVREIHGSFSAVGGALPEKVTTLGFALAGTAKAANQTNIQAVRQAVDNLSFGPR